MFSYSGKYGQIRYYHGRVRIKVGRIYRFKVTYKRRGKTYSQIKRARAVRVNKI